MIPTLGKWSDSLVDIHKVDGNLNWFDLEPCDTPEFVSIYVILDEKVAIIETGPACGHERLIEGLKAAGTTPADVDWILPTHIHLDHGGGAGHLAAVCPNARVLLHPRGLTHLVDPSRLWAGSMKVLGEVAQAYGPPRPIAPDQALEATDDMTLDLGSTSLRVLFTPGHASHHLCYHEPSRGWLFTGDSAGLFYQQIDAAVPVSPTPYRHDRQMETLERLRETGPGLLCYSHFGPRSSATERLARVHAKYRSWMALARKGYDQGADLQTIHRQLMAHHPDAAATEQINADRFPQRDTHLRSLEGMIGYCDWVKQR